MKSPYVTSYWLIIVTAALSCTICEMQRCMSKIAKFLHLRANYHPRCGVTSRQCGWPLAHVKLESLSCIFVADSMNLSASDSMLLALKKSHTLNKKLSWRRGTARAHCQLKSSKMLHTLMFHGLHLKTPAIGMTFKVTHRLQAFSTHSINEYDDDDDDDDDDNDEHSCSVNIFLWACYKCTESFTRHSRFQ